MNDLLLQMGQRRAAQKLCLPSELWGAESLDIWLSLFISFIVSGCSRQQLWPTHIDLGPQTLTCVPLSVLSSPFLSSHFLSSPLHCHPTNEIFCVPLKRVGLRSPIFQAWFVPLCELMGTVPPIPGPLKYPWITLDFCVLGLTARLPAECLQMQVGACKLCYIWHCVLRPSSKP